MHQRPAGAASPQSGWSNDGSASADEAGCSVRSIFEPASESQCARWTPATTDYAIAKGRAEAAPRDTVDGFNPHIASVATSRARLRRMAAAVVSLAWISPELTRVEFARLANVERMKLMYRVQASRSLRKLRTNCSSRWQHLS